MSDFLAVKTQQQVLAEEAARDQALVPEVLAPLQDALDQYVDDMFLRNREHRKQSGVDDALEKCYRASISEYTPEKLAKIREVGGSEIFMGLTGVKIRAAVAWLLEIFSTEDDKTWGLEPTPDPELAPQELTALSDQVVAQVQQEVAQMLQPDEQGQVPEFTEAQAQAMSLRVYEEVKREIFRVAVRKARNMELKIHDQMIEGKWSEVFSQFIWDLVSSKAGILKGPITRVRRRKTWGYDPSSGQAVMQIVEEPVVSFERVSPFDAFPSPLAVDFEGDFQERYRMTRDALNSVMDIEGYNPIEIMAVLEEFDALAAPSMEAQDRTRAEMEGKDTQEADRVRDSVEAIESWVSVAGSKLIDGGYTTDAEGSPVDPLRAYDITLIKVGSHRIFFSFNTDPLKRKAYSKMGWCQVPGSFWYRSVGELMDELQTLVNAAMRSLSNNMVIAAGPQVSVNDTGRLPAGEDITGIFPGKVWQFANRMNSNVQPLTFFQPDSNASELLAVYDKMALLADSWTGIPAYEYGTPSASAAGRTSSGLSMLMSTASRGIKRVILDIDRFVIKPVVERLYDYDMAVLPDSSVKGDMEVVATGAVAVMAKEQMADRRLNFLRITNNPVDLKITGYQGRARLLRAAASPLELSGEEIVQPDEAIAQSLQQEQQAQEQQMQQEMQLKMQEMQANVQLKQAELELKRQELDLKSRELEGVTAPAAGAKMASEQQRLQQDALRTYLQATQKKESSK